MQMCPRMNQRRLHAQERRRDRRIPVAARVRIEPREGSGVVQAELVDVSAGGLRAICSDLPALEARVLERWAADDTFQRSIDERPLDERGDVGVVRAPDEIPLPMSGNGSVLGLGGSFPDRP